MRLTISLSSPNLKLSCTTLSSYLTINEYQLLSQKYPSLGLLLDDIAVKLALLNFREVPGNNISARGRDNGILRLPLPHVKP